MRRGGPAGLLIRPVRARGRRTRPTGVRLQHKSRWLPHWRRRRPADRLEPFAGARPPRLDVIVHHGLIVCPIDPRDAGLIPAAYLYAPGINAAIAWSVCVT